MLTYCRINSFSLSLSLLLLTIGCKQASDPIPLDAAWELQKKGKTKQAIDLLVSEDIEKNLQVSSLKTVKMSEKQFMALFNWRRADAHEESLLMVPLIKKAAYVQIENMQSAQAAGLSVESKQMQEQLQRLIHFLQDKNRLLIYQQLGAGIQKKLKQTLSCEKTTQMESTDNDQSDLKPD